MSVTADVLLVLSIAATTLLAWGLTPKNVPRGPDRAMYGWICILFQTPRWIFLTAVLLMCASSDGFPFIASYAGRCAAVLVIQILLGGGCFICSIIFLQEMNTPRPLFRGMLLVPFVIPGLQMMFATWVMHPWLRRSVNPGSVVAVNYWSWIALAATATLFAVVAATVHLYLGIQRAKSGREARAAESSHGPDAETETIAGTGNSYES